VTSAQRYEAALERQDAAGDFSATCAREEREAQAELASALDAKSRAAPSQVAAAQQRVARAKTRLAAAQAAASSARANYEDAQREAGELYVFRFRAKTRPRRRGRVVGI
jgi:hypothetical protein